MRTSKQWDSLDRLTRIEHERLINITAQNPATISSYAYTYSTANQRVRVDGADGAYWVYGYDDLGQLVGGVKHAADDPPLPRYAFGYGYDDGQPSAARQQASPTLSEARPNVQLPMTGDGRWTYTWNGENRLVAMETTATAVAAGAPKQKLAFAYDHIGRRTTKKVYAWDGQAEEWALTSSLRFLYDGWNLVAEVEPLDYEVGEESFVYDVARSYVWGLDLSGSLEGAGGIGGLLFATSGSTTTMPTCDGKGNVVQYVGTDASVTFACSYSPFGQTLGSKGDTDAPYRFSSKYRDESGLLYYGYRYYDCQRGRWINRDPIGEQGGFNIYGICKNSTVMHVDTDGRGFGSFCKNAWELLKGMGDNIALPPIIGEAKHICDACAAADTLIAIHRQKILELELDTDLSDSVRDGKIKFHETGIQKLEKSKKKMNCP